MYIFLLETPMSSSLPVNSDSPDNVTIIVGACAGGVLALLVVIIVVSYIVVMICHGKKTDNHNEIFTTVILHGVTEANSKDEPFYDEPQFNKKETSEVHSNPDAQEYATSNFDHSDSYTRTPTPSSHVAHVDQNVDYGPIRSSPADKFDTESHTTKVSCLSQIPKPTVGDEYGRINQLASDVFPTVGESPTTKESCSSQAINSLKSTGEH